MGSCSAVSLSDAVDQIADRLTVNIGQLHVESRIHRLPDRLEDYYKAVQETLGTGYTGKVIRAVRSDGAPGEFAIKTLDVARLSREKKEELNGEVEVALALDHPNVVNLVDVFENSEEELVYLVMERVHGGELFETVQEKKRLSEPEASNFLRQMLLAVSYLHSHDIVHRDLKLENFLLDQKGGRTLKLIDFGFAKFVGRKESLFEAIGTPAYAAPEVLRGAGYNVECDLWSLGVILYIMLSGTMPFRGPKQTQFKAIMEGRWSMDHPSWNNISQEGKNLVKNLLVVDRRKRFTAAQALKDPFVKRSAQRPVDHRPVINAFRKFGKSSVFQRAALEMCARTVKSDEQLRIQQAFLDMDLDHSGTIDKRELRKVMVDEQGVSEQEFESTFAALDFNSDGEIRWIDYLAATSASMLDLQNQQYKDAFNRFDRDKSGYITVDELRQILGARIGGIDVRALMSEADLDGNHQIDFEEFVVLITAAPHMAQAYEEYESESESEDYEEEAGSCVCQ